MGPNRIDPTAGRGVGDWGPLAPRPRFDWLRAPRNRRSGLRDVERAIRAGWLDEAEQAARDDLVAVLSDLLTDPALRPREVIRVCRVLVAIDRRRLQDLQAGLVSRRRAPPRPRPAVG